MFSSMTKCAGGVGVGVVAMAAGGGLCGLHGGSISSHGDCARSSSNSVCRVTHMTQHSRPLLASSTHSEKLDFFQYQFKAQFMNAERVPSYQGLSHLCTELMSEVKLGPAFLRLLSPSLTDCERSPSASIKEHITDDIPKTQIEQENVNDAKIASAKKNNIMVLLYDTDSANDSMILKGCHITFSWTLFASVWSSVILFPVGTLWNIWRGAWSTVATTACAWLASLCFRLPALPELRRFIFKGIHKWFPHVDIIYEGEPPKEKTIFCSHPHGIFSIGTALLLDDLNYRPVPSDRIEKKNGSRSPREVVLVAAPFLRWGNPVFKGIMDVLGIHIHGAGRAEFQDLLKSGTSFALVPGGFSEATITCAGKERIYVNDRKGFVKYALRAGYSLTPVYVFGESDLYYNPQGMMEERLHLNTFRFQIPGVAPFGHPLLPLAPRKIPLRIVCGAPLELPKISNPSEEDISTHHARYVAALEALYYRHVESYHRDVYSKYVPNVENEKPRVLERW